MADEECAVNAQMLIRKPAPQVFAAFIDPEITRNFWFTKSTGKLEEGTSVVWHWEMYGVSAVVSVEKIIENRLIKINWDGPAPKVEFEFTSVGDNATYVTIKNYGCKLTGDKLLHALVDQACGFTTVLDGLKAYLEHNIKLNLIGDKFPAGK